MDLASVAGTAILLLPVTVPVGLFAGQTAFLAAWLGAGEGLLALRLWNAFLGLALHVGAIGLLSFPIGIEWMVISLAALGTATAGVALLTWVAGVSGLARRLHSDDEIRPRLRFSLANLIAATSIAATLGVVNRWAASFGQVSLWELLSFAAHQTIFVTVAVVGYGTLPSSRVAGLVVVGLGAIAGILLDRMYSIGKGDALRDFPFLAFELAHSSILTVWLTALRRTVNSEAPSR
jgi:hypothetical protein